MKLYLLSVIEPSGGGRPPAEDLKRIMKDVYAVKAEMQKAGVWVFACGLHPPETATVIRPKDGELAMIDGPFAEGKEHLGGLSIIKATDLDVALEWGRKLARATTLPIEVRPFQEEH